MSLREQWVAARTKAAGRAAAVVFIRTNGRGPRPANDPDRDLRAAVLIVRRLVRDLRQAQQAVDSIQGAQTLAGAKARAQAVSDAIGDELADFFDDE